MHSNISISTQILHRWAVDDKNILNSVYPATGEGIFKFCYQPESGEFICAPRPDNHVSMITGFGKKKFNDYIRGIYFKDKKIIYLRGHVNEKWLRDTRTMLRTCGVGRTIKIAWGIKISRLLNAELRGL